jgi:hypothetical protein
LVQISEGLFGGGVAVHHARASPKRPCWCRMSLAAVISGDRVPLPPLRAHSATRGWLKTPLSPAGGLSRRGEHFLLTCVHPNLANRWPFGRVPQDSRRRHTKTARPRALRRGGHRIRPHGAPVTFGCGAPCTASLVSSTSPAAPRCRPAHVRRRQCPRPAVVQPPPKGHDSSIVRWNTRRTTGRWANPREANVIGYVIRSSRPINSPTTQAADRPGWPPRTDRRSGPANPLSRGVNRVRPSRGKSSNDDRGCK